MGFFPLVQIMFSAMKGYTTCATRGDTKNQINDIPLSTGGQKGQEHPGFYQK